jgi:phage-related protein
MIHNAKTELMKEFPEEDERQILIKLNLIKDKEQPK